MKKLKRLRENCTLSLKDNLTPINILEEKRMISTDAGPRKCVGAYTADVSRFTKNKNNRIYPKALWERVIREQKHIWSGGIGLMDHPIEEGSSKDIFCVWDNLRIDESSQTVKADMYLVGRYGRDMNEVLEAGGRIELSSSGFGDFLTDGITVDPESYMLERVADNVLEGSQSVKVTIEDKIQQESTNSNNENIVTNLIEEKSLSTNDKTINEKTGTIIKEKRTMTMTTEVKTMLFNMKKSLKEAKKRSDLNSRLEELTDLSNHFSILTEEEKVHFQSLIEEVEKETEKTIQTLKEQTEEVSKKLEEAKSKETETIKSLEEATSKLSDMEKEAKELKESNEKKEEKLEKAYELMDEAKNQYSKLKGLYERSIADANSKVDADDYVALEENYSKLEESFDLACSELDKLKEAFKVACEELDSIKESLDEKGLTDKILEAKKKKEAEEEDDKEGKEDKEDEEEEEEEEDKDGEEEEDKKDEMKKSKKKESVTPSPVVDYYNDLKKNFPTIDEFENKFMECKTPSEVQILFTKVRPMLEKSAEERTQVGFWESSSAIADIINSKRQAFLQESSQRDDIKNRLMEGSTKEDKSIDRITPKTKYKL